MKKPRKAVAPLPHEHFTSLLKDMHWPATVAARLLGRHESTVRSYMRGQTRIPEEYTAWLERVASFLKANPAPQAGRRDKKTR